MLIFVPREDKKNQKKKRVMIMEANNDVDRQDLLESVEFKSLLSAAAGLVATCDFETMVFTNDRRVTVDSNKLLELLVAYHSINPLHDGEAFTLQYML